MASIKLCILLVSVLWLAGKQTCILGPVLFGNCHSSLNAATAGHVGNQLSTVQSCDRHAERNW